MMSVGDRNGERVGGIRTADGDARKEPGDHCVNLHLFCAAGADDRLLDQSRRIFAARDSGPGRAHQHNSAGLPELERGLGVPVDEDLFDGGGLRSLVSKQRLEMVCEGRKPKGKRRIPVGPDLAVGDMHETVALRFDQAPASTAKTGIEAENLQARRSSSSSGTS